MDIHPEATYPVMLPFYTNDLAYNRLRGGTNSDSLTSSNSLLDVMFNGQSDYAIFDTTALVTNGGTYTVTSTFYNQSLLKYGQYYGVHFGNISWRAKTIQLDLQFQGVTAWTNIISVTGWSQNALVVSTSGQAATPSTAMRWTFNDYQTPANTSGFRIAQLWGSYYNSIGQKETLFGRDGGNIYADTYLKYTPSTSTVATSVNLVRNTITGRIETISNQAYFLQNGNSFGTTASLGTTDNYNLQILANNTPSIIVFTNSNVSIGVTSSPTYKLQIIGTATNGPLNVNNNLIIDINGNVGIGKIGPSYLLDVNGDINIPDGNIIRHSGAAMLSGDANNLSIGSATVARNLIFYSQGSSTASIYINTSGQVGIGITSSGKILDVNGSVRHRDYTEYYFGLTAAGRVGPGWNITTPGGATDLSLLSVYNMYFATNNSVTPKMVITTAGNVGIGTASPIVPLQVFGTNELMKFGDGSSVNDAYMSFNTRGWLGFAGTGGVNVVATSTRPIIFGIGNGITPTTEIARFAATTGFFGIGTASPAVPLHVYGTASFNNNVGIGTSTPTYPLQVLGTASISGQLYLPLIQTSSSTYSVTVDPSTGKLSYNAALTNIISNPAPFRLLIATNSVNNAIAVNNLTFNPSTSQLGLSGSMYISSTISGSTLININGSSGQLFSVVDGLTGSIFNVNAISGLPLLTVNSDYSVYIKSLLTTNTLQIYGLTGSTRALYIDTNGNVGATALSLGYYAQGGNSYGATATLGTLDVNSLQLITNNSVRLTIATGGNVGIGTSAPTYPLQVNGVVRANNIQVDDTTGYIASGAGPNNKIFFENAGSMRFRTNNLERLTIDINGNVGIGTTGPSYPFTVVGTASFNNLVIHNERIRLKGFTVSGLPAGTVGDFAYVTDASAPTYLGTIVGGGSITTPVFYNGSGWIAH